MVVVWCGVVVVWCDVVAVWCSVVAVWCGVVTTWCGVVAMWCGVIAMWCGMVVAWCGVIVVWCGVVRCDILVSLCLWRCSRSSGSKIPIPSSSISPIVIRLALSYSHSIFAYVDMVLFWVWVVGWIGSMWYGMCVGGGGV